MEFMKITNESVMKWRICKGRFFDFLRFNFSPSGREVKTEVAVSFRDLGCRELAFLR